MMSNSEVAVDGSDNCKFISFPIFLNYCDYQTQYLRKEPLIIYFSVVKYRVVWLQWNIIKVILQFIYENTDPALGKV